MKPPEAMIKELSLGLKLQRDKVGVFVFWRGNEISELSTSMNIRELFSMCWRPVDHYPIAALREETTMRTGRTKCKRGRWLWDLGEGKSAGLSKKLVCFQIGKLGHVMQC